MPQRIRLGTVTNGTLDTLEGTIEIDNGDIYIVAENGDIRTDGNITFEDAAASPSANGEIQRNGSDLEAFSGGAVRSLSNIGSGVWETVTGAIRPDTAGTDVIPNGDGSLGTSSDPWPTVTADGVVIDETYHWASQYDGADADARLDAALSAASNGDAIFLESATYSDDRTISTHRIIGPQYANTAEINAAWTVSGNNTEIEHVLFGGSNTQTVSGDRVRLFNVYDLSNGFTVTGDSVTFIGCNQLTVTYESGTSAGVAVGNTNSSITDDGSNTVPSGSNS